MSLDESAEAVNISDDISDDISREEPVETSVDEEDILDPEIEAIKARVKEMEEEAEKLKQMQKVVDETLVSPPRTSTHVTSPGGGVESQGDTDARSVYVGNVDYTATATDLEQHFHGCGAVNRVTILCDKFTGHPKGFAYVEFTEKESVDNACQLTDSLFKGRQIKISAKRTNIPGVSSTNRGYPRGYGSRGRSRGRGYYGGGYSAGGYGGYRGRGRSPFRSPRRAQWYSPYMKMVKPE